MSDWSVSYHVKWRRYCRYVPRLDYEVNKDPSGDRSDKHGLYNNMACIMY